MLILLCIQWTGWGFQCAPLLHLVDSNIIAYFISVESTSELQLILAVRPTAYCNINYSIPNLHPQLCWSFSFVGYTTNPI